ncbi:MAG TPA: F0F1 ATP synthase subunit A [Victivallales bacterium]|nr:F0F1 ATP synthase subunit A [Victivallales bacterium]HPO89905.1 F0F1 ATP synthase subunit A [Victivallales bacterium]HRR06223.1 F0F1 ATP synthase subunit A [Victivallales bacterium]HRR28897.1 F0F1 ATP synthase subunit A [Victivallales bacterium]HRU01937.1 F0F1 ATP synthase subunit A [Victivallales bacterium]
MKKLFLFLFLLLCVASLPGEDSSSRILEHVSDGKNWAPLPFFPEVKLHDINIIGHRIPFTKHVLMLFISGGILAVTGIFVGRSVDLVPHGIASFIEPIVLFIRDSILVPMMGVEHADGWIDFFSTLFLFILTTNAIGLIPLFSTATANINITLGLAFIILILTLFVGISKFGPIGFLKSMSPHGIPKPIAFFIVLIEVSGLFIKNFVLAIRLFANMLAGHFVIISLLALIFIVHPLAALISIPLALFISLLESLVVLIQAFVFTLLSAIFISMASAEH